MPTNPKKTDARILSELFIDKSLGMSQRELEHKYDMSIVTINKLYRQIVVTLFQDNAGFMWQNIDKIKDNIGQLSDKILACPYCGQPQHFKEDME